MLPERTMNSPFLPAAWASAPEACADAGGESKGWDRKSERIGHGLFLASFDLFASVYALVLVRENSFLEMNGIIPSYERNYVFTVKKCF